MAAIELNEENQVMVYSSAIATFGDAVTPKKVVDQEILDSASEKIALWGDQNDFPQQILAEIKKNSDLGSLLHLQARVLYAGGVGYRLIDPKTGEPLKNQINPEIRAFIKRNWQYPIQSAEDFYRFFNFFPQFTLTKDRSKIKWLTAHPANKCRYSLQDKSGNISTCYVNANWDQYKAEDKSTLKLPVIDPMFFEAESLRKDRRGSSYVYGMSYPQGETYYSIPNWWALKKSKWLELANKIPAFKLALMNNQVTIKYHIQFPETHWEFISPGFKNQDKEKKKQIKQDEIKKIVDLLQGEEKAGKSIVSGYQVDPHTLKEYPGIKITAIDDKLKDGIYLEDSVEATIKLFTALGLDPAILGIVPGKGGSNRSGSDKREAIQMYTQLIQPHADLTLRPYDFAADYNGWNNENQLVEFYYKSAGDIPTLDKVTPSQRENINPDKDAA